MTAFYEDGALAHTLLPSLACPECASYPASGDGTASYRAVPFDVVVTKENKATGVFANDTVVYPMFPQIGPDMVRERYLSSPNMVRRSTGLSSDGARRSTGCSGSRRPSFVGAMRVVRSVASAVVPRQARCHPGPLSRRPSSLGGGVALSRSAGGGVVPALGRPSAERLIAVMAVVVCMGGVLRRGASLGACRATAMRRRPPRTDARGRARHWALAHTHPARARANTTFPHTHTPPRAPQVMFGALLEQWRGESRSCPNRGPFGQLAAMKDALGRLCHSSTKESREQYGTDATFDETSELYVVAPRAALRRAARCASRCAARCRLGGARFRPRSVCECDRA